jgi:hypothetical protein
LLPCLSWYFWEFEGDDVIHPTLGRAIDIGLSR